MANSEISAALRTFHRKKSYALINLLGLAGKSELRMTNDE